MTDFHKIWIKQCEAAEGIKERFDVTDATRYLIGEKLMHFLEASQERPEFAEELPKFISEFKALFQPHEIGAFFDDLRCPGNLASSPSWPKDRWRRFGASAMRLTP